MASDYNETNTTAAWQDGVQTRRSRPMRNAVIIGLLAFLAGSVVMVWAFTRWNPARKMIGAAPVALVSSTTANAPATTSTAATNGVTTSIAAPAMAPQTQTVGVDLRVSELEERIARIDLRAAAAAGNAGRAENLLVAFAARRAIDRGTGLGYIEGQVKTRFGETQPRAVAAVIAAGQNPVTIANLQQGLDQIAPNLVAGSKSEGWWEATKRTLSTLVVIRREGTPMPAPDERIARARLMLDGGQVDGALAEVARLPGQTLASNWMTAARRWVEAHRALDIIEAAAIMPPPVDAVPAEAVANAPITEAPTAVTPTIATP
jgi:hypothetical protein